MPTWLLVHPPLLGPAVLGPLADELRARGAAVAVPDLRGLVQDPASSAPSAAGWDRRWAAAVPPADVAVAFSGAGIVLPAVAVAAGAGRAVWLDAVLPPGPGTAGWPADVRERIGPLTGDDGRVADWTTWWGPDAMGELLPDAGVRAAVLAEGHRLPADLWSTPVEVPPVTAAARYVHLSASYDGDAAAARDRDWPVAGDGRGAHLDVATAPARVADLLG
ncbi:hypothetical protein ACWKWC_14260 [Geodermatophilus nigrescens]